MDSSRLIKALTPLLGAELAKDLVTDFIKIRQDFATKTLERASPGKFVETFVQCLQQIATGSHEASPAIDHYLNTKAENETRLSEGLRICAARIARSMYTLRNKRNVAHKNEIDPNTIDLGFAHGASAWIMAELLRAASGISMEEAGELIALVQAPVESLVEDIDGVRLVHVDAPVRVELLILLSTYYPSAVPVPEIMKSLERRGPKTVRARLSDLRSEKLLHGSAKDGYRLTQPGLKVAFAEIAKLKDP